MLAAARVSLPSDRSFATFESALATITGPPLPPDTSSTGTRRCSTSCSNTRSSRIDRRSRSNPALARLGIRVVTVLRFLPPAGAVRAFESDRRSRPGAARSALAPGGVAVRALGFFHILDGTDHLLFLACLVIPFRRFRSLVAVVTAFTVAHSITLIASAYDLAPGALWFPPLIETLIAISIVYMALENIVGAMSVQRRWIAGVRVRAGARVRVFVRAARDAAVRRLAPADLAALVQHRRRARAAAGAGAADPGAHLLFRYVVAERVGTIILSALVAHTALALDGGTMGAAAAVRVARAQRADSGVGGPLADGGVALAGLVWLIATARRGKSEGPAVN